MAINQLDLGQVFRDVEAIRGARSRNTLAEQQNALREDPATTAAQFARGGLPGTANALNQGRRLSQEQELANARFLSEAIPQVLQNEQLFSSFSQEAERRGIIPPNSSAPNDPAALQQLLEISQMALAGQPSNLPAGMQVFNALSQGLNPEDELSARRIDLGLDPRAGTQAGARIIDVPQADGTTRQMMLDPTGQRLIDLPTTGTQLQSDAGVERAPETIAAATTAATAQAETEALPERARVEAEIKDFQAAPTRLRASQDIVQTVKQLDPVFDRVLRNTNLFTIGFLSSVQPGGSPAADMQADLQTLGANAAFDRLQQMRDSSPTGGALGQVSERELALLQSAIAAIEQSQSPEQFRENVLRLRENYKRIDALAKQAQRIDRIKSRVLSLQNRPQTAELQSTVSNLRQQIFSIEDDLFTTMTETGVAATEQATVGRFQIEVVQ